MNFLIIFLKSLIPFRSNIWPRYPHTCSLCLNPCLCISLNLIRKLYPHSSRCGISYPLNLIDIDVKLLLLMNNIIIKWAIILIRKTLNISRLLILFLRIPSNECSLIFKPLYNNICRTTAVFIMPVSFIYLFKVIHFELLLIIN